MYWHQYFFGGKYDLIQLHRQIIYQNDAISMRNWLKSSQTVSKVNNKNDIAALAFWDCFCSSHQPSEIGPTAEINAAAIPLSLSFLDVLHKWGHAKLLDKRLWPKVRFAPNYIFLCRPLSPISFFSKNSYYHHHQEPNLTWRSPSRISKYSSFPTKVIFT